MYEQDFDLDKLINNAQLDLDNIDLYDDFELEEMLEWLELEADIPDEEIIKTIEEELNSDL